jgi:hypothetical protein
MGVGFVGGGSDETEDVEVLRCKVCNSIEVRIRTSTTQRLEGGRPLAVVLCVCGHSWKVIGTAPVRALVVRRQQTASPSVRR